jgi:hypothetical protein
MHDYISKIGHEFMFAYCIYHVTPQIKRIMFKDDSHHVHTKTHIHVKLKNI